MTPAAILLGALLWGPMPAPPCAADLAAEGGCLLLPASAVLRVYDGDTLTLRVPGWPPLFSPTPVRIAGFDAPEIYGDCAYERELARASRDRLAAMIEGGRTLRLDGLERGMYRRIVGRLSIDGEPVAEVLLGAGLARPYDGESAREPWCPEEDEGA